MTDPVNNPAHYKGKSGLEAIDVIEGFGLGFHRGNSVKYLLRAGKKDDAAQDVRKARWYIERDIERMHAALSCDGILTQYRLCYLATPYTKYHLGIDAAFTHASELTGRLIKIGVRLYSPIAHCHPISIAAGIDPLDFKFWLTNQEAMMDAADCLIVAHMKGWDESYGVKHEIDFFTRDKKPVVHLDPVTLAIISETEAAS